MVRTGIVGATGYTGLELAKLINRHPAAEIAWLTSERSAGRRLGEVFPTAPPLSHLPLVRAAEADLDGADVVFCCLPHAASQAQVAAARAAGAKVVDLSADFRLRDADAYETWYKVPHKERDLLTQAVYGLPELHRARIAQADLVANPGCYPTTVILGLAPLAQAGWLSNTVIVDSKSGVSGAGRKPSLKTHYVEANENLSPYSIGRAHRHLAEMEQELGQISKSASGRMGSWDIVFSPHLVPLSQGMLSTIYVTLPADVAPALVCEKYQEMYAAEPFVSVLPEGQVATVAHTVRTNNCAIGLTFVPNTGILIVTASIDNLIKGASGQAVQNMNIMLGMDETAGLV